MKPNIVVLIIDSLRADRFFGQERTCKTPNFDSLIKQGVYFKNAISSSDVTGICLGNIFTGKYSFKTGITQRNFSSNTNTLFDILKNNGYSRYATIPNLTWFNYLTKEFNDKDSFFTANKTQDDLTKNVGSLIINRLNSKMMREPWAYYIHLEDLHQNVVPPKDFDNEKFGKTSYDRMFSCIDYWISKILESIDLNNTLVIITADHGDYIPVLEDHIGNIPNIQAAMKQGKNIVPFLEPLGLKLFIALRDLTKNFQMRKMKKKLTEEEFRTLNARASKTLYEETQHVPILLVGKNIKKTMLVDDLVGTIDLLPTVLNILGIRYYDPNIDGRNLAVLFNDQKIDEKPLYIESGDSPERKVGYLIGIRTSEFKYLRDRNNSKKYVSLFHIKKDPYEHNNIAREKPDIVKSMEKKLNKIMNQNVLEQESDISEEDDAKIVSELKRLGYSN